LGSQGAACYHALTQDHEDLPKAIWDIRRYGMLCTTGDTFADWKQAIEQLCSYSKNCDYETQTKLQEFFKNMEKLQDKALKSRSQ
jgi:hypothetical protein